MRGPFVNYKDLEIWQISRELVVEIHHMTFNCLPRFERFEEGCQVRRSIKSVKSTIVEGYGRRRYKQDFIKYLTYALASNDETVDHLEMLFETGSLTDRDLYERLHGKLQELGRKLNLFIQAVDSKHLVRETPECEYSTAVPSI